MVRFRKILIGALLGSSFAAFLLLACVECYYYSSLPGAPDENTGRVYKMLVNHGFVRYGSQAQRRIFQITKDIFPVAGLLFLTAIVLGLRWGILYVRETSK